MGFGNWNFWNSKIKIKEIGFAAIPVTDIKHARSFYENVLGLKVAEENNRRKMDRILKPENEKGVCT